MYHHIVRDLMGSVWLTEIICSSHQVQLVYTHHTWHSIKNLAVGIKIDRALDFLILHVEHHFLYRRFSLVDLVRYFGITTLRRRDRLYINILVRQQVLPEKKISILNKLISYLMVSYYLADYFALLCKQAWDSRTRFFLQQCTVFVAQKLPASIG